jgi:hypothetical protein
VRGQGACVRVLAYDPVDDRPLEAHAGKRCHYACRSGSDDAHNSIQAVDADRSCRAKRCTFERLGERSNVDAFR